MSNTEKVLASINEERIRIIDRLLVLDKKIDNYKGNEQTHLREKRKLQKEGMFLTALRHQAEKHIPFQVDNSFYCSGCYDEYGDKPNYPCTFIKETANDLGIGEVK